MLAFESVEQRLAAVACATLAVLHQGCCMPDAGQSCQAYGKATAGPFRRREMELSGTRRRYRITSTYYQIVNGVKQYVPTGAALRYITSVNDAYSQGTSLSDAAVQAIVQRAIAGGGLGRADPNGMYFVLTSQARRPLQPLIRV